MKSTLLVLSLLIYLSTSAQTIVYKTNKWGDTKKTHDWATALDNPVAESVTIVQSPNNFKVTFGQHIKIYKVVNSSKMDENTMVYNTLMNGKPYIIKVMYLDTDKTYAVFCENEWAVADIKDRTQTPAK